MTGGEASPDRGVGVVTVQELGERGLIERVRRRLGAPPADVLIGVGDDAAAVAWGGETMLLTTDALLEDVHFRRTTATLQDIGAKALAVNLSDIAAMGGDPRVALLVLAVPPTTRVVEIDDLYAGLEAMAARYQVALIGGDTCAAPDRIGLALTVVGRIEGAPIRRSGARPGDALLVTGTLGAAAAGLAALEQGTVSLPAEALRVLHRAHRVPTPRVREGRVIHASGTATAMIDLSDGLAADLDHIAGESRVGARVRLPALPVSEEARQLAKTLGVDPWPWAVSGGEDYELLFTAPPERAATLAARVVAETGTPVTAIGEIRPAGDEIRFVDDAGRPVTVRPGFDHFA